MSTPRSLRSTLVATMLVLGIVAATGALALIGITAALHATVVVISDAVESVCAAEGLRSTLLMHERALVFDPFRRADSASRTTKGAGLGLFIASQIVRAHGGQIELSSELGKGSTFSVVLPNREPLGGPAADREPESPEQQRGLGTGHPSGA